MNANLKSNKSLRSALFGLVLTLTIGVPSLAMAETDISFVTNTDGGSCKSTAVYVDGAYSSCVVNNNGNFSSGQAENECLGYCTPAIVVDPQGQGLDEVLNHIDVEVLNASELGSSGNVAVWVDPEQIKAVIQQLLDAGYVIVIEDMIM